MNGLALCLSFAAITALEFSYALGGINWLDALIFLLVPAFILLVIQLVLTCNTAARNYCVAFTILIACMGFTFFRLSPIEFGTVGDYYHISKVVALSIKNNFFIQYQIFDKTMMTPLISDFVESIWGIFWRWTQWDFIIILLQALPIILLWQQLVRFFQKQNITTLQGPLAVVVILSLEALWCQQGSPYIDSIVGMLIGINLLLCYDFLTPPYERRFSYLAGLVFVSGLCLVAKPTGICVAILGSTIAFALGFRYLNTREKVRLPLVLLPSLVYFFSHQVQIQKQTGNFLHPFVDNTNTFNFFDTYTQYYTPLMFYSWIRDHAFGFKPLYVLSSWLSDYKLDSYITPAPYIRGNGLVFTYLVIPTLIVWLFRHKNTFKKTLWKDPRLFIFAVIFLYYYTFPGSIDMRFSLGYNILILSWCLSYLGQYLEKWRFTRLKPLSVGILCLLVLMSVGNYFDGIRNWRFERHILSPLAVQKGIFPHEYTPEIRNFFIQRLLREHAGQ